MPFYNVKGKNAIVTGAGSGICLAFAQQLLENGCSVVIADLKLRPEAEDLVNKWATTQGDKPTVHFHKTDVSDWAQLSSLWDAALEKLGQIGIVCNGAGIYESPSSTFWNPPGISSQSEDKADGSPGVYKTFAVNALGPIRLAQIAMDYWLQNRNVQGNLLWVASCGGYLHSLQTPLYFASKAAIVSFVKSLSTVHKRFGIRNVAVCPGAVHTPIFHPEYCRDRMPPETLGLTANVMFQVLTEEKYGDGNIVETMLIGNRESNSVNVREVPMEALYPTVVAEGSHDAVLWAHGTSGFFIDSAPSAHRGLYYENVVPLALAQEGYAVVAPDYAGLGVEKSWDGTDIPHQYFSTPAGAQDTLFAMEATLGAFRNRLSGKFAIMGHSQGGGIAWGAAEALAKEKDTSGSTAFVELLKGYVGTVSIAPVTKPLSTPRLFSSYSASIALSSIFHDFKPSQWLTPLGVARQKLMKQIGGSVAVGQQLFFTETQSALEEPDWYNSSYHAATFDKLGTVGDKPFAGPLLVIQGSEDFFIAASTTNETVASTADSYPNNSLSYMYVDKFGRTPIISGVRSLWMAWLKDRFQGKKQKPGLERTYVNGWLGDNKHFFGSNGYLQWSGAPEYTYQNPGAV
ncbi:secretory lipase [Fusarium circinatum]|uniref:Secretory lipase n=1 Tax=Fusarium circinatum TaxID=48490 RepID=A0A8H5XBL2_FUSCI|nr:secretory lipase [Fusarium circinatum]